MAAMIPIWDSDNPERLKYKLSSGVSRPLEANDEKYQACSEVLVQLLHRYYLQYANWVWMCLGLSVFAKAMNLAEPSVRCRSEAGWLERVEITGNVASILWTALALFLKIVGSPLSRWTTPLISCWRTALQLCTHLAPEQSLGKLFIINAFTHAYYMARRLALSEPTSGSYAFGSYPRECGNLDWLQPCYTMKRMVTSCNGLKRKYKIQLSYRG